MAGIDYRTLELDEALRLADEIMKKNKQGQQVPQVNPANPNSGIPDVPDRPPVHTGPNSGVPETADRAPDPMPPVPPVPTGPNSGIPELASFAPQESANENPVAALFDQILGRQKNYSIRDMIDNATGQNPAIPGIQSPQVQAANNAPDRGILNVIASANRNNVPAGPELMYADSAGSNAFPSAPSPFGMPQQQQQQPGLFGRIGRWAKDNNVLDRVADIANGWAMGNTPSESIGMGGLNVQQGNRTRKRENQTVNWLTSLGFSEDQSREIIQDKNLLNSVIASSIGGDNPEAALKREQLAAEIDYKRAQIDDLRNKYQGDAGLESRFGKAAPGYRWKEDGSQEPVPGGPVSMKQEELAKKKEDLAAGMADSKMRIGGMLSRLESALEGPRPKSGWAGRVADYVDPATQINIESQLDSLKGLIATDALQRAKASSPNGASGFGNLSNQEFLSLGNTISALRYGMSRDELYKSIGEIRGWLNKADEGPRRNNVAWQDQSTVPDTADGAGNRNEDPLGIK